jgi:hypothetical protein
MKLSIFGEYGGVGITRTHPQINLKVLTNEKRGGLKVVAFDKSPFKLFTLRFSPNLCRPHPVRGLKLLSEPCFCHFK